MMMNTKANGAMIRKMGEYRAIFDNHKIGILTSSFPSFQPQRIGVYKRASGEFDIKTYYQDAPQEGVRWNSDKTKAWKLLSGDAVEEISLEEAEVFRNNVCDASPFLAFILR